MTDDERNARLDQIVEVLARFARLDFAARVPVSEAMDAIDAIATGLNMLAEDLDGAVASRRELEQALRALTEAQTKLLHAAKLATAGQLASGVAHEVNNPAGWVSVAVGHARHLTGELRQAIDTSASPARMKELVDDVDALLEGAAEGAQRIRTVVGHLRTLARADSDETELFLIDDTVRATCALLGPSTRERAAMKLELGGVPPVRANRGRLGQVVANLVVNAAEALGRVGRKGTIEVATSTEGASVVLAVDDDGPGVPETIGRRVFDPYFTTSATGTGLGLSLVAEIVARCGGDVRLSTSARGGARFEVRLPIATE